MTIRKPAVIVLTLLVVGLSSTGCTAKPAAPQVTETVTVTAPPPSTETPQTTPTDNAPEEVAPEPVASGPQVIIVDAGSTRTLTLNDAFGDTDSWKEGSFQAAGVAEPTQAIATVSNRWCSERTLEFRFAQNEGTFSASVAQAMDSKSSTEELEWALIVDGRKVSTKRLAFKEITEFETPLTGVAVVQLTVKSATRSCAEATALVTSVTVQG